MPKSRDSKRVGVSSSAANIEDFSSAGSLISKMLSLSFLSQPLRVTVQFSIIDAYHESRLLYFDKKRSQHLAGRTGSKPQVAIRDTDFTNNIAQFWWNVNKGKLNVTQMQQNKFSVSEADAIPDDYKEFANSIPRRDSEHLRGIVNRLAKDMHKTLKLDMEKVKDGYRTKEYTSFIESVVEPMVMEYMKTGDISEKTVKAVFEANYNGTDKKKANDMKAFEKSVLSVMVGKKQSVQSEGRRGST